MVKCPSWCGSMTASSMHGNRDAFRSRKLRNYFTYHKHEAKKVKREGLKAIFRLSKPAMSDLFPPARTELLSFSNSITIWEPPFQVSEHMEAISSLSHHTMQTN